MMTVRSSIDPGEILAGHAEEVDGLLEVLAGQVDGQVGVPEGVVVEEVHPGDATERLEDRAERDLVAEAQVEGLAGAFQPDGALELLAVLGRLRRRGEQGLELVGRHNVLRIKDQALPVVELGLFLLVLGNEGPALVEIEETGQRPGPHEGHAVDGLVRMLQGRLLILPHGLFVVLVHLGLDTLPVVRAEGRASRGGKDQDQDQGCSLHGRSPCFGNVLVSPVGPWTTMASAVSLTTLYPGATSSPTLTDRVWPPRRTRAIVWPPDLTEPM